MIKTHIDTSRRGTGVLLILLSLLCFGLMQIFVALSASGIGIMEQAFFRNAVGLVIMIPIALRRGIPLWGTGKQQLPLFGRSLSGFAGVLCLFYALHHASQADVTIVARLNMFGIAIVSAVLFSEHLSAAHIASIALAFTGAYIAADPSFESSALPMLGAFGNAVFSTVAYSLLSYFSGRADPLTVVIHFCTVSTVISLPLMLPSFVLPDAVTLVYLICIGLCATAAQTVMTYAYKFAPAGELNVYSQLAIMINSVLGLLILNQVPSVRTIIGGSLALAASFGLYHAKKRAQAAKS